MLAFSFEAQTQRGKDVCLRFTLSSFFFHPFHTKKQNNYLEHANHRHRKSKRRCGICIASNYGKLEKRMHIYIRHLFLQLLFIIQGVARNGRYSKRWFFRIMQHEMQNKTKNPWFFKGFKEATTRFELVIRVLQTHALPLGYVATMTPTRFELVLPPWKGDVLTTWPWGLALSWSYLIDKTSSPSRTWTYDSAVNSRVLYRLSYRGLYNKMTY